MTGLVPVLIAGLFGSAPLLPAPARAAATTESFVVVIGSSRSDVRGTAPLRFADDDAARYYELFSQVSDRVLLLAVLDDETQRRHPDLATTARVPSVANVGAALDAVRGDIKASRARGNTTALYFVYAGHGHLGENREGYLALHDGRFTRADLFAKVMSGTGADTTHVILDACDSYFMVAKRGEGGNAAAIRQLLDAESLDRHPSVGVLVATTTTAEVHEWSAFSAGVFSHEVRSAMVGGGDVDGDRRVTYAEVGAFVAAANARVTDPRGKISVYAVPPRGNHGAALIDWRDASTAASVLDVQLAKPERFHVEDDRGVRVADLFPSASQRFSLVLPRGRTYYARGEGWETRIGATGDAAARIELASLTRTRPEMAGRGSITSSFERGLFAVPFGEGFFEGYVESNVNATLPPPRFRTGRWRQPTAWTAIGTGAGSAAAGLLYAAEARRDARRYRHAFGSDEEVAGLRAKARRSALRSEALFGLSAATTAAGAWVLWLDRKPAIVSVGAGPDGANATFSMAFGGSSE